LEHQGGSNIGLAGSLADAFHQTINEAAAKGNEIRWCSPFCNSAIVAGFGSKSARVSVVLRMIASPKPGENLDSRKPNGFDNLTRSNGIGPAGFDLQSAAGIFKEQIFPLSLIGDHAFDMHLIAGRTVLAI